MAIAPRTKSGLIKFRPVERGAKVALVAPASPFDPADFERGVAELKRLGFDPQYDDSVFARGPIVAGTAQTRAQALHRAWSRRDIDAVIAVRGGYGSVETLPLLDRDLILQARTAFIGYSDVTSLHAFLAGQVGLTSVHGPMIERRLSEGAAAYDETTFLACLGPEPVGELSPAGLEVVRPGEAAGPLFGGTLTQLVASLGTPYEFSPPAGYVLFIDEVSERPYRLRRMLVQMQLSGRLARASAIVFGQLPRCDEPDGSVTPRMVLDELLKDFPGPVLFGFPSGHTTSPLVSLPFGVETRVIARGVPRLIIDEPAAG